jgi:chaperonin cofactor prefoldin
MDLCSTRNDYLIRGSDWLGSMIVNDAALANQWEAISDLLLALPTFDDETTLFTRVGDTFTEVSLSMVQ